MIAHPQTTYLTPENYLLAEESRVEKHEYINGEVYAMAGAEDAHVTIAGNLFALLRNHVRGKDCRVFIADMKARIEELNIYYYPDVLVTCDPRDRESPSFKRYPCLIVEVLSASTEAFDRGDKFADYQHLESLQEYVLINQKRQRVECFRRNAEGLWVLQSYHPGDTVYLTSLGFECSIAELYEDVDFPERVSEGDRSEVMQLDL
ncbi:MAG: Uma2 family endonuclease [Leptolyngbyaceae cyanobacterium bins.302]|nr:Uma2 family endonuclease [Leptolyngbyaceae cyanobacterium bins.302]